MDGKCFWQYDEFRQVCTDYGEKAEVETYDSRHSDFRDTEAESLQILDSIGIVESDVLIDFGSGTGTFALLASRQCRMVHAVDVSRAMIDYARERAVGEGATNIFFHQAGFLSYEHEGVQQISS